jgi:hypothetical protein
MTPTDCLQRRDSVSRRGARNWAEYQEAAGRGHEVGDGSYEDLETFAPSGGGAVLAALAF